MAEVVLAQTSMTRKAMKGRLCEKQRNRNSIHYHFVLHGIQAQSEPELVSELSNE